MSSTSRTINRHRAQVRTRAYKPRERIALLIRRDYMDVSVNDHHGMTFSYQTGAGGLKSTSPSVVSFIVRTDLSKHTGLDRNLKAQFRDVG